MQHRGHTNRGVMSVPASDSMPHPGDVFSEAGKKCVTCGARWVAFGATVKSRKCPFCGESQGARIIRGPSTVRAVTPLVSARPDTRLTILRGRQGGVR